MKKRIFALILAAGLIISGTGSVGADSADGGPPGNSAEAVAAALARDPEISAIRARENNMLARLSRMRTDPTLHPDAGTAELIADMNQMWRQHTERCYEIAAEVLTTLMAIDTERNRQIEFLMMLEGLEVWLEIAQTDFRMSVIEPAVMDALREKNSRAQRDLAETDLRLSEYNGRFRELTGFTLPTDFDFRSAWLVTDVDSVTLQPAAIPAPVTLFTEVDGVVMMGGGAPSPERLANNARVELMDLHDAISRYAAADKLMEDSEGLHRRGEITRYQLNDAVYDRLAARVAVHERKQMYAAAMLELDMNLAGIISSRYRAETVLWFFEADWVYEGRQNVSYDWAGNPFGWWQASAMQGRDGRISIEIHETGPGGSSISRAAIYYDGRRLAEGRIAASLDFDPPDFNGNSLIEVVFTAEDGSEINRVYIDGFKNAGRFFDFIPPASEEEEDLEDNEEEEAEDSIEVVSEE